MTTWVVIILSLIVVIGYTLKPMKQYQGKDQMKRWGITQNNTKEN